MSAMAGMLAVDAAVAGIGGLSGGIARSLTRTTESYAPAMVTDALGERWEVARGYFKTHAACRYTHGALDAVMQLRAQEAIDPDAVETVLVETYPTAARLDAPAPANSLQAKFSLPFAVATALVHGATDKTAFATSAITDETLALADRVSVREDASFAAMVPDQRPTRVRITLRDGSTHDARIDHPRGGAERPFTAADLSRKFAHLTAAVPSADVDALWDALTSGPMPSVDTVVDAVSPR
jgi:2-methylcitrate dehydratase PrpD